MATIRMTPANRDYFTGKVTRYTVAVTLIDSIEWQYTSRGQGYRTTTAEGWRDLVVGQHVTDDRINVLRVASINGHGQPVLEAVGYDEELAGQSV